MSETPRDYLADDPNMVTWSPGLITLEGMRVDPGDVVRFLARLAVCGNVADACKVARISRATVYRMRADIPEFRTAWDRSIESSRDVLEREAWRRAVEGVPKPIVHAGKVIGAVREYSDRLLALLLQAKHPEFARTVGRIEMSQSQVATATAAAAVPVGPPTPATVDLLAGVRKLAELAEELVAPDREATA